MSENKKQETKKIKKSENELTRSCFATKKSNIKVSGLDIDKAEYQEIVLSNSNFPDRDYFKGVLTNS